MSFYLKNVVQVYRSVLLSCRTRRNSGESDSSKNGTSGQSSPVNVENAEKRKTAGVQILYGIIFMKI